MAGGFLAVGACISAATKNQVIAFILSVVTCFGLLAPGSASCSECSRGSRRNGSSTVSPAWVRRRTSTTISKGVIDLRDLVYFALLIGMALYANTIVLELKKAD